MEKVDLLNKSFRLSFLGQFFFYFMGGGRQLSEPGEDENARDRMQFDMFVIGMDENAVPVKELVQKKCFLHPHGTGVAANDNVTCMLKRSRSALWTLCTCFLGKIPNTSNQKLTSHNILPVLKLLKFQGARKYISYDFSPFY